MSNSKTIVFIDYFLEKRLKRVPTNILEKFLEQFKEIPKSFGQDNLVNEIIAYYKIMKENKDFIQKFNEFIRDYVLSARESNYLLRVKDKRQVITWIKSWIDNKFHGQYYEFSLHVYGELEEKYIEVDGDKAYLPNEVILLVAKVKNLKKVADGLRILEFSPTSEIEIIFRKDSDLIEVRGQYQIIRDFISTSRFDQDNPLSSSDSIFIGENSIRNGTSLMQVGRQIGINALKESLEGKYLTVAAPISGSVASRLKVSSDGLEDLMEETNETFKPIIHEVLQNPEKCSISFKYHSKTYSFGITRSGGLTFMKYTPEEVVTYILQKIKNL